MKTSLQKLLLLLVLGLTVLTGQAADRPLWLACGSAELLQPLEPLVAWRQSQGLEAVAIPLPPKEALAQLQRRPDYLLIVGDDDPSAPRDQSWQIPAPRLPMNRWSEQQRPDFPSDSAWVPLGADGLPQLAAGRLPVRTPEEARQVVAKILAWEKQPASRMDLTLPMWAGDPAYNEKFTGMFMDFLFAQISKNLPAWLEPWIVSGDVRHPLCGWPTEQAQRYSDRTQAGGLFTGMIGHGSENFFCSVQSPIGWLGYHEKDAVALTTGAVRPPHVIFACECGVFDLPKGRRSLAEHLLLAPSGPVLSVAAANESHPLPNFYTATNLLQQLGQTDGPITFGQVWLRAQKDMRRRTDFLMEVLLKGVEGNYGAAMDPQALKHDQGALYTIFGDPATRLRTPRKLEVKISPSGDGKYTWQVTSPASATNATLSVETRSAQPVFAERPAKANEAQSRALFAEANQSLAFRPVPAEGWSGTLSAGSIVRFIVESPEGLWVAGAILK